MHRILGRIVIVAGTAAALALSMASGKAAADDLPLFADDAVLSLTIEMPLSNLIKDAEKKPELAGVMRFTAADGKAVSVDMMMTTRGRSRLAYCRFPPLKIDLTKEQVAGTLFDGQNKLKIVTHCRDGELHERYLQQEFGIYKAYNELTNYSFRVRWLNITYRDTESNKEPETHIAFFIESEKELASRLGMDRVDENRIPSSDLNPVESTRYALFQFLIANTDWSMIAGPGDEGCCHNGKLLRPAAGAADMSYIVIPYDFDQSGVMHTKYSTPADALKIRSVRQRLYRGRCRHNDELPAMIAEYNRKRPQLENYLAPSALAGNLRERALRYVDDFYQIVNDPGNLQKQVYDACVGS